jgi:hypothetical protein
MGSRTLLLSGKGFSREAERTVYIPDPSPHEQEQAYETRVRNYLDQQYGVNCWREPEGSRAAALMRMDLQSAAHIPGARDQLQRLQKRAAQSLKRLNKRFPLP